MSENRFKKFLEQLKDPNSAASAAVENASFTGLTVAGTGLGLLKFFDYAQSKQLKYSDVLRLFREGKVSAYHLDMSSRNLVFQRKDSGAYGSAIVPDTQLFLKDIHKLVKKHNEENPDDPISMDYSRGIPNWVYFALIGGIATLLVLDNALWNMSQNQQQMQIRQDQGRQQFTKSKFSLQSHRTATFDDVAGAEEEKEELKEIVEYLRDPEKFTRLGARVPKGVLMVGPPGTGKTLLARAVAGEAGVPFFSVSGSEFVEMYVGVGAARVRDLFAQAKANAPAIVFIDEIDALARKRATDLYTGNEERETTLNQLLVEMDGFTTEENIILIGATNRADVLDPALMRPGRFDRQVHVGYPDIKAREAILKVHIKEKPLADEVDLSEVAKNTTGFTGADLENLLNEAALLAAKRNKTAIGNDELKEAAVKVMMGAEKRSRKVTDKERRLTAFHEAGHAVATYYLDTQDPVTEVSIIPRGSAGGYTMSTPQEDKMYMSRNEMLDELVTLLGGRVAEALVIGDISTGASNDLDRATSLAKGMITRYGMDETIGLATYGTNTGFYGTGKEYSETTATAIDEAVKAQLKTAYDRCEAILTEHRDQLDRLAEYLLEHEKIDAEGFNKLMEA
ncbi:MAG: ATP-dependent zinc metalloprotease FtsH [Clostridia bacterium]|nr:ATP-dependent zinc metalloprotease FtsH [Clostridia bacterium]MBQ1529814.1 ATP-dependent zinc metalloprotease FtsH [Clostridia bacterium]MBQ5580757.1 ATP-dependent zinc metalloprotease FtsH [Clostridia bacterium]MEE1291979.1 ATP-dependent zinc metalloprotease FtsH [Acutalibacteraceae bacterium]